MFNRMFEVTSKQDYEARLQQTAQENYATRVERATRNQAPWLARLSESLEHLGLHLQGQPHAHLEDAVNPR